MRYLVPRKRGWNRLLRTAILAFCLATCLRVLLSGTTIESYLTPFIPRSVKVNQEVDLEVKGQGHELQGEGSPNAPPGDKDLGNQGDVKNKIKLPKKRISDDEDEKQEVKKEIADEMKNKTENENLLEDEDGGDLDECPYKDSRLERFKCFLPAEMTEKGGPFDLYLGQRADKDRVIFLISVDNGYVEMGLNLYESSFKRLGMTNYLFVCSDEESAKELDANGVDCYVYEQGIRSKAARYWSKDFILKTHVKTKIILAALYLGYNVFLTDADIVYLKNPQAHLACPTCDLEIQSDHTELNSGFYLVKPTEGAILLHQKMMDKANQSNKTSNQKALNNAVAKLKKQKLIKYTVMEKYKFPCGIYYFERFKRMWAGDNKCKDCIIVHNNWIVGKDAKIYRFKEHLLWFLDTNGYYSDEKRKYLYYDNPTDWGDSTRDIEVNTLKRALQIGHVLNRTVILPAFTCKGCASVACKTESKKCALNTHLRLSVFNGKFSGLYREHVFLSNPKVPKSVKSSISPVLVIGSANAVPPSAKLSQGHETFIPRSGRNGATVDEMVKWFGRDSEYHKYSVLHFTSLYNAFQELDETNSKYKGIMYKIKKGFKKATYRQL